MTKDEMLKVFLEETGFSEDVIVSYGKYKAMTDNSGNKAHFKRYALAATIFCPPVNYNLLFMSDKFDQVKWENNEKKN